MSKRFFNPLDCLFSIQANKPSLGMIIIFSLIAFSGCFGLLLFIYLSVVNFFIIREIKTGFYFLIASGVFSIISLSAISLFQSIQQRRHPEEYIIGFTRENLIYRIGKSCVFIPINNILSIKLAPFTPKIYTRYVEIKYREGEQEKTLFVSTSDFSKSGLSGKLDEILSQELYKIRRA